VGAKRPSDRIRSFDNRPWRLRCVRPNCCWCCLFFVVQFGSGNLRNRCDCSSGRMVLAELIKRLEESGGRDEGRIRCRFSLEDLPTLVASTLGQTIELECRPASCRLRLGYGKWTRVDQADLLEKLAPSVVEEGVHRSHANPRAIQRCGAANIRTMR